MRRRVAPDQKVTEIKGFEFLRGVDSPGDYEIPDTLKLFESMNH